MHIFIREISHGPLLNVQRYMIGPYEAITFCFYRIRGEKMHTKEPSLFCGSLLCQSSKLLSDKM